MFNFDSFVVFAEMRTGSNFLESNLNAMPGVTCHGEAFNPHFIGYPNSERILGITQAEREADPMRLLAAIGGNDGLNGFRYFNDHDPRVLDAVLADRRCGKIILTRNPVESYVSWKIAQATGQWKLTNVKHAKSGKVPFDAAEFEAHLNALQAFQVRLLNALQKSGQTAFYVAYEDLQDLEVMNGLALWLGVDGGLPALDDRLKRQNPAPMPEKVTNFDDMERSLARLDRFDLSRTPNFEPRRGAAVPSYVAAPESPLLFLPVLGGPTVAVRDWLAALDGASVDALASEFTQKTLRQWKRRRRGHRSFTVLRHPVARAHAAFCDKILETGGGAYLEIRKTLRQVFKVDLPEDAGSGDAEAHRRAFEGFLGFVRANLAGQTSIRVDGYWASQTEVVRGMAQFALPDMVLREETLEQGLGQLAAQIGRPSGLPVVPGATDAYAGRLAGIYDEALEGLVRDLYQRDYMTFGFGPWR